MSEFEAMLQGIHDFFVSELNDHLASMSHENLEWNDPQLTKMYELTNAVTSARVLVEFFKKYEADLELK